EPPADGLGDHLPVLEQGKLPDRLAVILQRGQLAGEGHLAFAVAAQGDGLQDRQVGNTARGARRQVSQSYPAASTSVKVEGNAAPRPDTISGLVPGPGLSRAGRAAVRAASAPGSVEHSAEGSPVVNEIARPARSQT